jgi:hypothetical protein
MTETRDLVEARAFLRRRLASAFDSGHPDRPLPATARLVVVGLVLATAVAAGAAAAGHTDVPLPSAWSGRG